VLTKNLTQCRRSLNPVQAAYCFLLRRHWRSCSMALLCRYDIYWSRFIYNISIIQSLFLVRIPYNCRCKPCPCSYRHRRHLFLAFDRGSVSLFNWEFIIISTTPFSSQNQKSYLFRQIHLHTTAVSSQITREVFQFSDFLEYSNCHADKH
jgi:hypothetical protein